MHLDEGEQPEPALTEGPIPIMDTNDSSIVSKRSVEHTFYNRPHFLRYFVKKRKVQEPLINRGYWLRMQCIERTILNFCRDAPLPSLIINLGAGYDALPFRLLSENPDTIRNTIFLDVDYAELLDKKVKTILAEPELYRVLGDVLPSTGNDLVKLSTQKYWALGCDLQNMQALKEVLANSFANGKNYSILLVSEMATCYMAPEKVDELLEWFAHFESVTFCLLEQHLPCGPSHPFAETMLSHFERSKSSLRSIKQYPTMRHQHQRFKQLGWHEIDMQSLWQYWCYELSFEDRQQLDDKEVFDEWEEFALYACHYFLLVAKGRTFLDSDSTCGNGFVSDLVSRESTWTWSMNSDPINYSSLLARRAGALYFSSQNHLHYHGGFSGSQKSSTITISLSVHDRPDDHAMPLRVEPRVHHTVTQLNESFDLLLVGGRALANHILSECWARIGGNWQQSAPLPNPLYRHSATAVQLSGSNHGVLVYGGRTKHGRVSSDCFLWRIGHASQTRSESQNVRSFGSWSRVTIRCSQHVDGRYSAAFAALSGTSEGLLLGGLSQGGSPLLECFSWKLRNQGEEHEIYLEPLESDAFSGYPIDELSRFGGILLSVANGFALIGGVGVNNLIPQYRQIVLLRPLDGRYVVEDVDMKASHSLLIGHTASSNGNSIFVVGGGAMCHSFGAFNNISALVISERVCRDYVDFSQIVSNESAECRTNLRHPIVPEAYPTRQSISASSRPQMKDVESITAMNSTQFEAVLEDLYPVILKDLDFGQCTALWTPEHLVNVVGFQRSVSVHRANDESMAFQPGSKNFKYVDCPFGEFVAAVCNGGKEYFRALSHSSASTPANLSDDFPGLANEFRLPQSLEAINKHLHSSVLRISGPVCMWLHYDVLANVLVQISGKKILILFPPSDVSHLDIPAGSSSSRISVSELFSGESPALSHTHPHHVTLEPGDALFIPPLWLHCAKPNDGVSIAVNVFFRNMENGYAAGRDAYGNRDVQAYEEGRRDIAKIVSRLRRLPGAMTDFYLQRLLLELREEAARNADTRFPPS